VAEVEAAARAAHEARQQEVRRLLPQSQACTPEGWVLHIKLCTV
jgi:hypothetical protein